MFYVVYQVLADSDHNLIFYKFLKLPPKSGQRPWAIAFALWQISSKMARREFSIFIIFSDTYTCSYVVYQVLADSDHNLIFYEFLKLLQNRAKDHGL